MVSRRRTRTAERATPTLTVHQVVAFNFARIRNTIGWTQVETSDRLAPFLGYKLNQAGVSAIEKTYDSDRRRNIDTAEVVAFARCFGVPIGWFFLPPPDHAGDLVEPLTADDRYHIPAAELVALTLGTPSGWRAYLDRVQELLTTDEQTVADALVYATQGRHDPDDIEAQLNLRRQAIQAVTLARHVTPADEVIGQMARLLVQLVKLTPVGFAKLRDASPDEALVLLTEGDDHLRPHLAAADERRGEGQPSAGGFDSIEPIDLERALARSFEEEEPT